MKKTSRKQKLLLFMTILVCGLVFYAIGVASNLFASPIFSPFFIISSDAAHGVAIYVALTVAVFVTIISIALTFLGRSENSHERARAQMPQTKKTRVNQDTVTVLMIGAVLMTGVVMMLLSALQGLSFLAVVGVSVAFWSILLLFFTPTKHEFLALLRASASAVGSNIERSLIELNSAEKGVYLPPQNLQGFESSLIFVPKTPQTPLPASNETNDKLFTEKKNGLLLTPPGLALSLMFEQEAGLSFRKITLPQMQIVITKLVRNLNFAEDARVQIQDKTITLEVTGGIFNMLCQEASNSQPRTYTQVGCILASAFACAFAKASDKPIIIQKETLNADTKTLTIDYRIEEV